jgi:hypothetical protein
MRRMHIEQRRISRRLGVPTSQRGFTLVEVMVGGVVLVVGLVMSAQFFASAASRVLDSDIRSVLHQVATEELETIRGLPYGDVGTTDGFPRGNLSPDEDRSVQNLTLHIHREVIYWTDPSYSGPYPANYRRVTVTVSAVGRAGLAPVELVSNVAGGATGGALDIRVRDPRGNPIKDAFLSITNSYLVPSVNIHSSALRTDSQGHMLVPGLTPDPAGNYVVSASKSGYNTATEDGKVVQDGVATGVDLIIDKLCALVIKVFDTDGNPVEGLSIRVIGPEGFDQYVVTTAAGVTLADLRYATTAEQYVVSLEAGQGYDPQDVVIEDLQDGATQEVVFTVAMGGETVTTSTSTTSTTSTTGTTGTTGTTSTTSTTSTTLGKGSLRVTVYKPDKKSGGTTPVQGARVTLSDGQSASTNSSGWVFFDNLDLTTYGVSVTATNYQSYSGFVTIVSGANTLAVTLTPLSGGSGGGPPPTR